MAKTKSRIFAALALTTALTAPALIVPMLTAPPALAGEATHDFADLAAKVTPAVVNVSVTLRAEKADADEMQMSDPGQQSQMQEFMHQFAERFGKQGQKPQAKPDKDMQAVGTGFIVDPSGVIVTNFHVAGKATKITVTLIRRLGSPTCSPVYRITRPGGSTSSCPGTGSCRRRKKPPPERPAHIRLHSSTRLPAALAGRVQNGCKQSQDFAAARAACSSACRRSIDE